MILCIPTRADLLMCTCVCVYPYAQCISMAKDYLANFLRLKVLRAGSIVQG